MKITTATARRLLREANPVPDDANPAAAPDARLRGILGGGACDIVDFGTSQGAGTPADRRRWRREHARRGWRAALPAAGAGAAVAAILAVVLLLAGNPAPGPGISPEPGQAASGSLVELVANLTAHPPTIHGDASAELRWLAGIAAAQPAPAALGPVEYVKAESWGLDLGTTHYGLSYRSHQTDIEEVWAGSDGAFLMVRTWPGGKVPAGNIPVSRSGPSAQRAAAFAAWSDPARLPASEAAMRQRLLGLDCPSPGQCAAGDSTSQIVTSAEGLMGGEPLPPAARAAILRVLADTAANPGAHQAFYDLGSVTDRAGHKAVAIAYEKQEDLTPAPGTAQGAAPGASCTTSSSGGGTVTACGSSGNPSGPASGPPSHFMESSLVVLVFDPDTGALLGEEYAYCNAPVGAHLATGKCFATSYDQILQVKAVQSIPATPTAAPDTPPS